MKESDIRVAWARRLASDTSPDEDALPEDEGEEGFTATGPEPFAEAEIKGLEDEPPVPSGRLSLNDPISWCWVRGWVWLSELIGSPRWTDQIQELDGLVGSIEPEPQSRQLSQRTFAVMTPSGEIPEPSRTVIRELGFCGGRKFPSPERGDTVTLVSEADHMMKILAPAISEPWPSPSHWVPFGAVIWKYIGPRLEEAVESGTLTV